VINDGSILERVICSVATIVRTVRSARLSYTCATAMRSYLGGFAVYNYYTKYTVGFAALGATPAQSSFFPIICHCCREPSHIHLDLSVAGSEAVMLNTVKTLPQSSTILPPNTFVPEARAS
jgi:hypothetical protein